MKVYMIIEIEDGKTVWTDGKTYNDKEVAASAKSRYQKFFKKDANLKVITLDMSRVRNVA